MIFSKSHCNNEMFEKNLRNTKETFQGHFKVKHEFSLFYTAKLLEIKLRIQATRMNTGGSSTSQVLTIIIIIIINNNLGTFKFSGCYDCKF